MQDKITQSDELLLKYAVTKTAELEGKELLSENNRLKQEPQYHPNEKDMLYLKNMMKKGSHSRRQRRKNAVRVYAVAAILLISSLFMVTAFRNPILDYFFNNKNFDVYLNENYSNMELHKIYVPTFLPKSYKADRLDNGTTCKIIKYLSKNGDSIWFTQYANTTGLNVDKEGADIEKVQENGFEATIIRKNGVKILWGDDDKIFLLYAELSELESDLLRMAKSMTFVE